MAVKEGILLIKDMTINNLVAMLHWPLECSRDLDLLVSGKQAVACEFGLKALEISPDLLMFVTNIKTGCEACLTLIIFL